MKRFLLSFFRRQEADNTSSKEELGIAADAPIRNASEDRLRRAPFAARIGVILTAPTLEGGRVFAIRGAWGDGKSSMKNMVAEQLDGKEGAAWLDFNPWQWGDGDAIARALFRQMADKLGGRLSSSAERRAKLLRKYGTILTGVGHPLEKAGSSAQTISLLLTNVAVVALAGGVGLTLPSVTRMAALLATAAFCVPLVGHVLAVLGGDIWSAPLDEIRRTLEKSLRKLRRPLVVFVDDIDRLEQDQIRLLFRQVKVNANLPNIVFVLLFQPHIVEAALNPIANNDGRAFLEKIVQANFDLPSVPVSMVRTLMTQELTEVAGRYATPENGFEEVRWGNILFAVIQPFVQNLRDSRHYISSVAIHLPLHVGKSAFEANILDFLALEAIRVFEPDFHAALFPQRELLLQASSFRGDGLEKEHRARIEDLMAMVPEQQREVITAALKELFPRIAWVFGGSHYTDGQWELQWIKQKRVCTRRFFPRYFELQTPEGDLSESDFNILIDLSNDEKRLDAMIDDIRGRGLVGSLAARLDESVDRLPIESAAVLLPAMFRVAQSLSQSRSPQIFDSPWVSAWRSISWYISRLPASDRAQRVLAALRATGALSVTAVIIHLNDPKDRESSNRREPAIDAAAVEEIKREWLLQVRRLVAEGCLLNQPDLGSVLFRWRDYAEDPGEVQEWLSNVTLSDPGFGTVVCALMITGTKQGFEDRVASRFETFNRANIDAIFGLDEVRRRIQLVDRSKLSPDQIRAIAVLEQHLNAWSGGEDIL